MISSIIIEDEPIATKIIEGFISAHNEIELAEKFDKAEEALDWLKVNNVDVIFQDINLPDINGVEFVKSLAHPPKIIFITANPEYAVEGFSLNAVDYLVKPVAYDRFKDSVEKLKSTLNNSSQENALTFKSNSRTYFIKPTEISLFESAGDYIKVFSSKHDLVINRTMKQLEQQLDKSFIRIHKSYIVNKNAIEFIEGNQIKVNNRLIPIGATYRVNLKLN
ncbi:response regulator transcription factor [Fulvivirga sp. RKSG066]|uniref:LytR/AlgR family response regulator transcription factor n=1 Tax=Fulvivirga aurantia TaxID=2529383 RepID=UPI0012BBF9A0|nr:LytTR family DNA-binding domain-containing protein [Fulvivirga aurantia]MTI20132.1 response regulator transcription factor [Fulvivirga aurantia]